MDVFAKGTGDTFLDAYPDSEQVATFRENLERRGLHAALVEAPGNMLGHIVDNLRYRRVLAETEQAKAYRDKMGNLNDIPILRKDLTPQEDKYGEAERKSRRTALLAASRRFDPRNWDRETGKGKSPHQVLTAWTVMVDNAVDLLLKVMPKQKEFPYATGWTFSHKKHDYVAVTRDYGWSNVGAKCMRPDPEGELRYFLLNPLEDEAFKIAYDHRDAATMAKMWAMAMHEVAHVVAEDHNTAYAYVLTEMMQHVTPDFRKRMEREVAEQVKAVTALYGKGRTRSAPLDDEPGPRPTERLLAGIVPDASMAPGPDGGMDLDGGAVARLLSDAYEYGAEAEHEAERAPGM
jgi:hypothetical protein